MYDVRALAIIAINRAAPAGRLASATSRVPRPLVGRSASRKCRTAGTRLPHRGASYRSHSARVAAAGCCCVHADAVLIAVGVDEWANRLRWLQPRDTFTGLIAAVVQLPILLSRAAVTEQPLSFVRVRGSW